MISKEEVQHIAKLARIELTGKEIEKFQKDLSSVLDYFEILKTAPTDGIEPMTHSVFLQNVTRKDEVQERSPEIAKKLVEMASDSENGFVKVKEVFSNR